MVMYGDGMLVYGDGMLDCQMAMHANHVRIVRMVTKMPGYDHAC